MGEQYTIPAACLEALGGLRDEDPPVLSYYVDPVAEAMGEPSALYDLDWLHPLTRWSGVDWGVRRILVRQSAPALLAVLERVCPAPSLCRWLMRENSIYSMHDWSVVPADLVAKCVVVEAIAAHGSDPGWRVEVVDG